MKARSEQIFTERGTKLVWVVYQGPESSGFAGRDVLAYFPSREASLNFTRGCEPTLIRKINGPISDLHTKTSKSFPRRLIKPCEAERKGWQTNDPRVQAGEQEKLPRDY